MKAVQHDINWQTTKSKDGKGKTIYSVKFEGHICDLDATNAFDKTGKPVVAIVEYDSEKTQAKLEADGIIALGAVAGLPKT